MVLVFLTSIWMFLDQFFLVHSNCHISQKPTNLPLDTLETL